MVENRGSYRDELDAARRRIEVLEENRARDPARDELAKLTLERDELRTGAAAASRGREWRRPAGASVVGALVAAYAAWALSLTHEQLRPGLLWIPALSLIPITVFSIAAFSRRRSRRRHLADVDQRIRALEDAVVRARVPTDLGEAHARIAALEAAAAREVEEPEEVADETKGRS